MLFAESPTAASLPPTQREGTRTNDAAYHPLEGVVTMFRRSFKKTALALVTTLAVNVPAIAHAQVTTVPPTVSAPVVSPPVVSAQSGVQAGVQAIELDVTPGTLNVPTDVVQQAISHELGVPVVAAGIAPAATPSARGRLRITMDGEHRIVLSFRDTNDREVIRLLAQPEDPTALLAAIVLIAGNLARNQVDDLLADLTPQANQTAASLIHVPPPAIVLVAPQPVPAVVAAAPMVTAPVQPPAAPYDLRAGILRRRFSIGLEGYVSTVATMTMERVISFNGLTLSYAVHPNFALGINHLTVTGTDNGQGTRIAINGGPFAELRALVGNHVQPFAQIGLPLQWRMGGGLEGALGMALYAGGGVRFRLGEVFTLGLGARVYAIVTSSYLPSGTWLPMGAVSIAGGAELAFHF